MKKFLLAFAGMVLAVSSSFGAVDKLYGVGSIEGWGNWTPTMGCEFTKVSDGVFTWSGTVSGTCYFAFASQLGSWDVINSHRFSPDSKDKLVVEGDNDMVANKDLSWKIEAGEYTFTINTNTMKLNVTRKGDVEIYTSYDVWGPFYSDEWSSTEMEQTEGNEDEWSVVVTPDYTNCEFGIRQLQNGNQSDWYAAPCNFNASGMSAVLGGGGNCKFSLPVGKDYKFVFVPSTKKLTITECEDGGVDNVAADANNATPEYFNLQGVKVDNPASGNLYIIRKGNSVEKRVVR